MKNKYRIYVDTSVFGGCFDEGFIEDSKRVILGIKSGVVRLVLSDTVVNEVSRAPDKVQEILKSIPLKQIETVPASETVKALCAKYLGAKIVSSKFKEDAEHVAYATVARVDAIVSWNFKHLVRFDKIKAFNQVNFQNGYGIIQIVSPKEVLFDE